jgi:hypothetical protein
MGVSPLFALKGENPDPGATNVRKFASPPWRFWPGADNCCVVSFTSFSEAQVLADGTRPPISAGLVNGPSACFAAGLPRRRPIARMSQKFPPTSRRRVVAVGLPSHRLTKHPGQRIISQACTAEGGTG